MHIAEKFVLRENFHLFVSCSHEQSIFYPMSIVTIMHRAYGNLYHMHGRNFIPLNISESVNAGVAGLGENFIK